MEFQLLTGQTLSCQEQRLHNLSRFASKRTRRKSRLTQSILILDAMESIERLGPTPELHGF